jgi:hypothetical protein
MTRLGTAFLALALGAGLAGCRSTRNSDGDARDPLYGRYIPKQDLPIPGRDSAGKGRDPLLASPTSSGSKRVNPDEPFRNSQATTPAGLAANVRVEDTGMSMGDRRTEAQPVIRGVPLRPSQETVMGSETLNQYAEELRRLRARYDSPIREANGDYTMTATVPNGKDGALKRYEAGGPNAAAAAKQLVEQIKADGENKDN